MCFGGGRRGLPDLWPGGMSLPGRRFRLRNPQTTPASPGLGGQLHGCGPGRNRAQCSANRADAAVRPALVPVRPSAGVRQGERRARKSRVRGPQPDQALAAGPWRAVQNPLAQRSVLHRGQQLRPPSGRAAHRLRAGQYPLGSRDHLSELRVAPVAQLYPARQRQVQRVRGGGSGGEREHQSADLRSDPAVHGQPAGPEV